MVIETSIYAGMDYSVPVGAKIYFKCPPGLVFMTRRFEEPEEIIQCFENGAAPPPTNNWRPCVTGDSFGFIFIHKSSMHI